MNAALSLVRANGTQAACRLLRDESHAEGDAADIVRGHLAARASDAATRLSTQLCASVDARPRAPARPHRRHPRIRCTMAPRPPPPVSAGPDEVEAQFYEALQRGDLERLMAVWADDDEIVCVHPGGPRVIGPAAIRASFEAMLARGGIAVVPDQVHRLAWAGGALHHLVERLVVPAEGGGMQEAWVITSNIYVRTPQGWRLAAHHASPGALLEPSPGALDAPSTLH